MRPTASVAFASARVYIACSDEALDAFPAPHPQAGELNQPRVFRYSFSAW
jgi:hypothetical protein